MTLAGIDESKATTLHLSKKQCCFFACYFIFFIVAGTSVSALLLIKVEANDVVPFSILIGLSAGMASGGTYYARKLYKAALDERLILEYDEMDAIINFGSMLYLVSRSVVAILLALVTVVALLATLVAVTGPSTDLTVGFVYAATLTAFTAGYSSGALLERLDEQGVKFFEVSNGVVK